MDRSRDAFVTGAWRTLLAMLALAMLALAPARAQPANITPELIAESPTPAPGRTSTLALSRTPGNGWHGYWLNGGDAGFGRGALPRVQDLGTQRLQAHQGRAALHAVAHFEFDALRVSGHGRRDYIVVYHAGPALLLDRDAQRPARRRA